MRIRPGRGPVTETQPTRTGEAPGRRPGRYVSRAANLIQWAVLDGAVYALLIGWLGVRVFG